MNNFTSYATGLILGTLLAVSCSSTKESAAEKAYKASIAHSKLIEEMRRELPCDTSTIIVTKTDTAFVFIADTSYSHDTAFVTKTKTVTNTVYRTATVVDSAYGKLWQDRYDQAGYLLQNAKEQSDKIASDNAKKDEKIQIQSDKIAKKNKLILILITSLGGLAIIGAIRLYLKLKP